MRDRWDSVAILLVRWRVVTITLLLLLTIGAATRAVRLQFDFSFRNFLLEDTKTDEFADTLAKHFGNLGGNYLVALLQGGDVFRSEVLSAISDMADAAEQIPHVERVFSLATAPYLHAEAGDLSLASAGDLVADGADPNVVRAAMLASPLYARRLVSPDGQTTAVLALLEDAHRGVDARRPTIAAFEAAVSRAVPRGFTVRFTGYPVAEAEYARLIWTGFVAAETAGILLMAVTLYCCFHTLAGVILPLVTVGVATVLTLGFMQVSGQNVTMTNASSPLLLLIIGVSETSYFLARYYEEAAAGGTPADLVRRSFTSVAPPALFAAATTSAGFLSLMTGHIPLTRNLGLTMAVGVALVFAVAIVLVPGLLSLLGPPSERATRPWRDGSATRLLSFLATLAVRHPMTVVVASGVALGLGLMGGRLVVVDQYATRELARDNPVRTSAELADAVLTGAFQTQVGVRARDGGSLERPDVLRRVAELQDFLASQPHVVKVWSIVDYLKELHVAAGGGSQRVLPTDAGLLSQYLFLLSSAGRASDVSMLIDPTRRLATIMLGTDDLGTAALLDLHRRTQAFVHERLADVIEFRFAGDYWLVTRGADSLVRDFLITTLSSFALVFTIVWLFLRSTPLTLLSVAPNVIPMALALGLMGIGGMALRVGTSIILPVSLGVAVDSTIQFLARVRAEWGRDGDYRGATRRALLGTGRGMVFSSFVLVVGFLCFLIPQFAVFGDIGILGAATLGVALVTNTLLTPALVWLTKPLGAATVLGVQARSPTADHA